MMAFDPRTNRYVMGIINCTPDSFYTGTGQLPTRQEIATTIAQQLQAGADILDFGGCSTRPGADSISPEEEWSRLQVGLEVAREVCDELACKPLISIDTFHAEVARRAITEYGVGMINDISAGEADPQMYPLIAESGVTYVAMHMRGTPQTMTRLTDYTDIARQVAEELASRIEQMLQAGIAHHQIVLDPGFGFAKAVEQSYQLVAGLEHVVALGYPMLVGISRKSMITKALNLRKEEALPATTALHWELLRQGAAILRVHDVAAARQVVDLFNFYEKHCEQ